MPFIAAPTPAATIAASEIGASITRSWPELRPDPLHLCEVPSADEEVGAEHEDRLVARHLLPHALLECLADRHLLAHRAPVLSRRREVR